MAYRNIKPGVKRVTSLAVPGAIIAVWDTEATGLSEQDRIIQFSGMLVQVQDNHSLSPINEGEIDMYINPGVKLSPRIQELTGITNEMVSHSFPIEKYWKEIINFLDQADVWAGQNLSFDIRMLHSEAARLQKEFKDKPALDTLKLAPDWIKKGEDVPNFKLGTIYEYLFPNECKRYHNSMEDVKATAKILEYFIQESYAYTADARDKTSSSLQQQKNLLVRKADLYISPYNHSQTRIRLLLSEGEYGDVYYDVFRKVWDHKKTSSATKLFSCLDMEKIEGQLLRLAAAGQINPYSSIDDLADDWMDKRKQENKKKKRKEYINALRKSLDTSASWLHSDNKEYSFQLLLDHDLTLSLYAVFGKANVFLVKSNLSRLPIQSLDNVLGKMESTSHEFSALMEYLSQHKENPLNEENLLPITKALGATDSSQVSAFCEKLAKKEKGDAYTSADIVRILFTKSWKEGRKKELSYAYTEFLNKLNV